MHHDAPVLRSHWWPRPGWRPGRLVYTWHLTFGDAADFHRLAREYQSQLAALPDLNLVPIEWLHLTVQGVGYTDEVSPDHLLTVADSVADRVAKLPAFDITFTRPVIFPEAIVLPPAPAEPLQALLWEIRSGMADALGSDAVPTGPEQADGFRPHVSLAYSAGEHITDPYRQALDAIEPRPAPVRIDSLDLICQDRRLAPDWVYRWTTEASAPLNTV